MDAVIVCVDYSMELSLTLAYNRHHFGNVVVVTTPEDEASVRVAESLGALVLRTSVFYERGALFNKYAAVEQALDMQGRKGWLCVMDADVALPKEKGFAKRFGTLETPLRRMYPRAEIPREEVWEELPVHPNLREHAGYCHVFHADDAALGRPPWYEVDWTHAGGADSFFQAKWPFGLRKRPPWECLHMGEAGRNWAGRSDEKRMALKRLLLQRRHGSFAHEKLST